jgi:hypothetical protein
MIGEYQCSGCLLGGPDAAKCPKLQHIAISDDCFQCSSHVSGTSILGVGRIALGLPKGFNRVGMRLDDPFHATVSTNIRLWDAGARPSWNRTNVPAWAMEHEGALFVRTYLPRLNQSYVDVVDGGTLAIVPTFTVPFDVGTFIDEID